RHERGLVRVWERSSGRLLREFGRKKVEEYRGTGFCALSPDGALVAVGGSTGTGLWRVADGKRLRGLGPQPAAAAFSPAGRLLARAADAIRFWDVATGKQFLRTGGGCGRIGVLAFSRDGRMLACGGEDDATRLWEVASGEQRRRLPGHGRGFWGVRALAFA